MKLITPNIDAALLEKGYVRPFEAALWVKKEYHKKSPFISGAKIHYKIIFDIGDALLCMEDWYSKKEAPPKEKLDEAVRNTAKTSVCVTYSTEKDLFAKLLILTADFYYHRHNKEAQILQKKYEDLFEKFTGLKYK